MWFKMAIMDIPIADIGAVIAIIIGAIIIVLFVVRRQNQIKHIVAAIAAEMAVYVYADGDVIYRSKAIIKSIHPAYSCIEAEDTAVLRIECGTRVQLNKCTCQSCWFTS